MDIIEGIRVAVFRDRIEDYDWMNRARCRGADPAIFHPLDMREDLPPKSRRKGRTGRDQSEKNPQYALRVAAAKEICWGTNGEGECPVRKQCLEWALEHNEKEGVWGGASERERRKERRRRQRIERAKALPLQQRALWRAVNEIGPATSQELAEYTEISIVMVRGHLETMFEEDFLDWAYRDTGRRGHPPIEWRVRES